MRQLTRSAQIGILAVIGWVTAVPASACPFPPPAVRDLKLMTLDSAAGANQPEAAVLDPNSQDSQPVRDYLRTVTGEADVSFLQETESLATYRAKCAAEWLEVWARDEALLGVAPTPHAIAERRGALSGAALAYLKIKPSASAEQAQIIEAWLTKLTVAAQFDLAEMEAKPAVDRYWLGLALGATATATNNEAMWQTARAIMRDALSKISENGTLLPAAGSARQALQAQIAALVPLSVLAELGSAHGENFYQVNNGALHRLAAATIQGLDTQAEEAGGMTADPQAGWLQLYALKNPERVSEAKFELPAGHAWLGGNVLILHRALTATTPAPSSQDP